MSLWLWIGVAHALTLEEARAIAEDRAFSVEQALAMADASHADAGVVLASSLPSVVVFADASTGAGFTSFGFERPVRSQFGVGVQGRWTVVAPSSWAAASAARQLAEGQRAMAEWTRVEARRQATVGYALALASARELELRLAAEADALRAEDAVKSMVDAGLRTPAELARVHAEAAAARANRVAAEGEARARCAELQGLLRQDITGNCTLEAPIWAESENTEDHPALVAAAAALGAAEASTTSAWLGLAPTVEVQGTAAEYLAGEAGGPGWSASVGADLPVFSGGSAVRAGQAARSREDAARLALDEQRLALQVAETAAALRLASAKEALAARQDAYTAADAALARVDELYRAGLVGVTDWLAARGARDAAAIALAGAEADLGVAVAELDAARGVW